MPRPLSQAFSITRRQLVLGAGSTLLPVTPAQVGAAATEPEAWGSMAEVLRRIRREAGYSLDYWHRGGLTIGEWRRRGQAEVERTFDFHPGCRAHRFGSVAKNVYASCNSPLFPTPDTNPTVAAFGTIRPSNQSNYARRIQLSVKFFLRTGAVPIVGSGVRSN